MSNFKIFYLIMRNLLNILKNCCIEYIPDFTYGYYAYLNNNDEIEKFIIKNS